MQKEIRSYQQSQIRLAQSGDGRKLYGLAIPYNSLSRNLGGFVERIMPGAFSDSIRGGLVAALFNHDMSKPIASQQSGNLRMTEMADGVHVEIDLPKGVSYVEDMIALEEHREGTGMSFGFNPTDVNWTKEAGQNVAEVRKGLLCEVSPLMGVPPAYGATALSIRSLNQTPEECADRYGIDLDNLAAVFLSIKRGLPLSKSELEIMQQARSLFAGVRKPLLEEADRKAKALLID